MRTVNLKSVRQSPREQLIRFAPYIAFGIIFVIIPLLIPAYFHSLLTKVLIFAIFAMSLDIIMGYTGLPSLGHAAFFGVGGYTVSILLVMHGIENFWLIALIGILMAALAAAILGIIALRASGIYFLLVTFALGMLLFSMAVKWWWLTRGYEGIFVMTYPELGLPWITWNYTSYYFFVFIIFVISFFLMRRLVNSPFGHALQGIRENETRMRSLGYNTWLYKYIAFIIAGLFAGVAGALFPYYAKAMIPYSVGVTASTLVMLMCIIGGLGTLWGPVIGAIVVILVEYISSLFIPDRWPLVLGGVFVITVMFLRGGIAPHLAKLWERAFHGSTKG
jgi:branched-chain amino acid transport system permease protein